MKFPAWALVLIIVAAIVLVVIGVCLGMSAHRRRLMTQRIEQRKKDAGPSYAFVVNPSKPEADKITRQILDFCASHKVQNPLVIETQLDKDGSVCARQALAEGADVVVAVGGDGTVRTVASALAGTGHAFGIVPIGTGNLFARNMGIPLNDIDAALQITISHGSRQVDMGRIALLDSDEPNHRHGFLILAGVGFDAQMIHETDPTLKRNIGWLAYLFGGIKHLLGSKDAADITIERADGSAINSKNVNFRTFMAGNCGQLPGLSLIPQAAYDDGQLDFVLMDTEHGILGWANLLGDVIHQTVTGRAEQNPLSTSSTVEQVRGIRAVLKLRKPTLAEVDGDLLGRTQKIELTIDKQALIVRAPEQPEASALEILAAAAPVRR